MQVRGGFRWLIPVFALVPFGCAGSGQDRIYELRTYTTADGRLDALHARFRDHTCRIFEKHGMTLVGFWTPTDEDKSDNTLIYVLAYPSREHAEAAWKAFREDPEWQEAYKASMADGPIVTKVESVYMTPTDYSAMK
jgi:hypothetical protein